MPHYAAFLRGMNLGKRRVTNDELRAVFEQLDFENVQPFLASGNIAFDDTARGKTLQSKIEDAMEKTFNYTVPTIVRSKAQIQAIADWDEGAEFSASDGKLQVILVRDKPTTATINKILKHNSAEDQLACSASEVFWKPSGNLLDSTLDVKAIEAELGTITVRTKRTIDRFAVKCFSDPA